MRRTTQKERVGEGLVRRCVAEEIGRRLGAREVTETPEFIGLDEFSVSGRRLYHTAICNLVKGEVMEVVEGQGRQKVEEYLDSLLNPERVKGVAMDMHEAFPSSGSDVPAPGKSGGRQVPSHQAYQWGIGQGEGPATGREQKRHKDDIYSRAGILCSRELRRLLTGKRQG